jgi:hypothetical protein
MGKRFRGYCYYCGAIATSLEHAPPKQMFKGFLCDSITVPSCDIHNTKKSGNDQAIVSAFLLSLRNGDGVYSLESDIKYAIELATPSFERAKRKAISAPLVNNPPDYLANLPNTTYISPDAQIMFWIKQLTAALVFDATRIIPKDKQWNKDVIVWSPNWIRSAKNEPMELDDVIAVLENHQDIKKGLEDLEWLNGWSSHPNPYPRIIYRFKIHFSNSDLLFCHTFYNRYDWYALLHLPYEMLANIARRAAEFNARISA